MKQSNERTDRAAPVRARRPTPIRISRRTRNVFLVLGFVALVLLMWAAPTVPVVLLGGFALAMALSFPVRWLSRVMPRGLAILATFLILIGHRSPRPPLPRADPHRPAGFPHKSRTRHSAPSQECRARRARATLAARALAEHARPAHEQSGPGPREPRPEPRTTGPRWAGALRLGHLRHRALPLRGDLRRRLLTGERAQAQGCIPHGGPQALPPGRPRALGGLRLLALALPERARPGHVHTGCDLGGGSLLTRCSLRASARSLGLAHGRNPLPWSVARGHTRGDRGPHRLAHHGALDRPLVSGDSAARGQRLAARDTGDGPQHALDIDLAVRDRGERDSRAPRGHLRRAHSRGAQGALRLLPRPPPDGGLGESSSIQNLFEHGMTIGEPGGGIMQAPPVFGCDGAPTTT